MAQPTKQFFTIEEYFAFEEKAEYKSEYYDGQIFAMAGGSPDHSLIGSNIGSALKSALKGTACRTFSSDLRIAVKQKGFFSYPDAAVICGKIERAKGRSDTVTNPKVIVEVLSPSTEKYDRAEKFELYRPLKSFDTYLLVDSKRVYVEIHQKKGRKWEMEPYESLEDVLKIESLDIELSLTDFYEGAEFITEQDSQNQAEAEQ